MPDRGRDDRVAGDDLALGWDQDDVVEGETFFELTGIHERLLFEAWGSLKTQKPRREQQRSGLGNDSWAAS
jgi:hypothetical protein